MLDFSELPDVSRSHASLGADARLWAAHMEARERALHHVFGETDPPGTVVSSGDANLSVNWPGGCVLVFPPADERTDYHYVTHGLAQPLAGDLSTETVAEDPTEPPISGWGIELVISTPMRAEWPADVLFNLVRGIVLSESPRVILPDQRIPCNGPIVLGTNTPLSHLLAVSCADYPNELRLPAGYCSLVHLIGASDAEIQRAKAWGPGGGGSRILAAVLMEMGVGCRTDPARRSVTDDPAFDARWRRIERDLEAEWRSLGWDGAGKG